MQSLGSAPVMRGPSSNMARNSVKMFYVVVSFFLLTFGECCGVYPKIVQGLMFLNSVKHRTKILAHCTS